MKQAQGALAGRAGGDAGYRELSGRVHREPGLAPGLEATVDIGRAGEAQLLQRRGKVTSAVTGVGRGRGNRRGPAAETGAGIVAVTPQRIVVLDAGRSSMKKARGVVAELPRSVRLGPGSGAWHVIPAGEEKLRVHRRFFKDIRTADEAA